MTTAQEKFLLELLDACAQAAPAPLYPAQFAIANHLDRDRLDEGLDELRRCGLIELTEWVKDLGQGRALTEAGRKAKATRRLDRAPVAEREARPDPSNIYERGEIVRRAIFDPPPVRAARILLYANLLYFAFGAFVAANLDPALEPSVGDYLAGDGATPRRVLAKLGALRPSLVFPSDPDARPQYERLLLSSFLHFGLLHLFMNMYILGTLGQQIEGMWGTWRFVAIYFVSGIVSSCVVLLILGYQQIPLQQTSLTAGASGCMFGIVVAMMVWFALNYQHLPPRLVEEWRRGTVINVFLLVAINFVPNVSWQGHLGGAIGGLLAALLLHVQRFNPSPIVRWLALAGVAAVPVAFFFAMLWQAGRL